MKPLASIIGALVLCAIIAAPLLGQEAPPAPAPPPQAASPWKGNLELSYLQTDGNTDSQTLAAAAKVERSFTHSKLSFDAKGIYGKKEDVTSDKSWIASLKYDRTISERASVFLLETVERNTLKGIEFRYSHQGGIGYYFIKTSTDVLKGEAGAGYVREDPVAPFHERGFPTGRLFGGYTHSFTEKNRFEQTVEYLQNLKDGEDYLMNEETALISNLMGQLALKISFAVTFDHLPPEGFEKSDRVFKTALLYTF